MSVGDTEHLMAVETSFSKGAILDVWDASYPMLQVNHFDADKDESLICRVFIKAEMILLFVYVELHTIYFGVIFYTVLSNNSFS